MVKFALLTIIMAESFVLWSLTLMFLNRIAPGYMCLPDRILLA